MEKATTAGDDGLCTGDWAERADCLKSTLPASLPDPGSGESTQTL